MKSLLTSLSLLTLLFLSCEDNGVSVPDDIPLDELLASPDTVVIEGRHVYMTTFIWRDFMPVRPPDGKPLIALVYVTATDSAKLPSSISATSVWIVFENQVWASGFSSEQEPPDQRPNRIVRIARNGPRWGPSIYVTVIVRLHDSSGNSFLLRASDQWIHRTD